MNPYIKKIKNNLTPDVTSTLLNNVWSIIKGPITLIFIPLFLSEIAQGYWYTFASIAALAVLADLGFTTIVGQFAAHEFAYLKINNEGRLEGEQANLEKIISLFRFVFKWAASVAILAVPIIMTVGIVVLNTHGSMSDWLLAWLLYVPCTGFNFIINTILSFFEGCNQIKKIQINRLIGNMVITLTTWAMLAMRFSLYTLAFSAILGVIANVTLLVIKFKPLLKQMIVTKISTAIKWFKNFMSLIWRYALSWSSGYLVFQIYTPLAFMFYNPIQAGKVGITLTLVQACFSIANVWIYVITPKINMCVAKADWKHMDRQLYKGVLLSMATYLAGAICILGGYAIFSNYWAVLDRFLGIVPISMLLLAYFLQIPINGVATYGRAHKREPYVIPSIVSALFTLGITLLATFILTIDYIFLGITLSSIVFTFVFITIYIKRKQAWHEDYIKEYSLLESNNAAREA